MDAITRGNGTRLTLRFAIGIGSVLLVLEYLWGREVSRSQIIDLALRRALDLPAPSLPHQATPQDVR